MGRRAARPDRGPGCLPALTWGRSICGNLDVSSQREWLVTNGIGGYAAGTITGLNTRRYHGVLVAALRPPGGRTVLVSKLDATVAYRGRRYDLACNEFADGTIDPRGYEHLDAFALEGQIPVWRFSCADAVLEVRLWMAHGRNTTYVVYSQTRGGAPLELTIAPLCTYRDYHGHTTGGWEPAVRPRADGFELAAFDDARSYCVVADRATFDARPDWFWHFRHRQEAARGLDETEDLFRPGEFHARLRTGQSVALSCTAEQAQPVPARAALSAERRRQNRLLHGCPTDDPVRRRLTLAADQFVVQRSGGRRANTTVIAGYPWFEAWGRDTMIALPGLTLSTGRASVAAAILRTFAGHVSEGMLPNRLPDTGAATEYNTVDAALWFVVAVHAHLTETGDAGLAEELLPTLIAIVDAHRRGTRYRIHVDPNDDLLDAGEPGVQLTWMDAKVGDWVVTPRVGKAVEINALWYNALRIMEQIGRRLQNRVLAREYGAAAARVRHSFERRFWFAPGTYLYDVVDGPDGDDASLRPNQIFALSLPFPLVDGQRARSVVDACSRELYTPHGLRTLAPSDAKYIGVYGGGQLARDGAYHQGTVWPWLLGPFATAHYRVHRDATLTRTFLASMESHLLDAGVGSISEIFDGDPPYAARGCPAQAWSVAEILRAWTDLTR